jgi:hypothetical protein
MPSWMNLLARTISLTWIVACGGEAAGPVGAAADPGTTGSPMSFDPTDPGLDPTTEADASTGAATGSTSEADTGTTADPTTCGNGIVEPGEGCDDGPANDSFAACTDACQPNVCGDGKIYAGVEACDTGPANVDTGYCRSDCSLNVCGDGYLFVGVEECDQGMASPNYGECDENCTVNRCGDGELDGDHEECDAGDRNGSGDPGEEGMTGCNLDCGFAGRRLFVSSKLFTGDMGSRAGADLACRLMAEAADFADPEVYRAVLGDSNGSLLAELLALDTNGLPIITPGGLILSANVATLIDLGPDLGVSVAETGEMFLEWTVWTNLGPFGDVYLADPEHSCTDWTSDDLTQSARIGLNAAAPADFMQWQTERQWLSYATFNCKKTLRIYCIETGD